MAVFRTVLCIGLYFSIYNTLSERAHTVVGCCWLLVCCLFYCMLCICCMPVSFWLRGQSHNLKSVQSFSRYTQHSPVYSIYVVRCTVRCCCVLFVFSIYIIVCLFFFFYIYILFLYGKYFSHSHAHQNFRPNNQAGVLLIFFPFVFVVVFFFICFQFCVFLLSYSVSNSFVVGKNW